MSSVSSWNNYLDRLHVKRNSNIHYFNTAQNISKLTTPFNYMSNQMAMSMRRDDAPMSAKMAFNMGNVQNFNNMTNTVMNEASIGDIERKDHYDGQISEAKFNRDEAQRIHDEQKKAEKKNMWGAIAQTGLTVAGAMTGNPALAMAGAGLGQATRGFITKDYASAVEGVGYLAGSYLQHRQSKIDSGVLSKIQENLAMPDLTMEDLMKIQLQNILFGQGKIKEWKMIHPTVPQAPTNELPPRNWRTYQS